jgi:hypothetical protein
MNLSEQIIRAFTVADARAVTIYPSFGTVRISRKNYTDFFGTTRSSFTAELLEKGKDVACKTDNPLKSLAMLHAAVSNQKRGTR